jgi:hypothetical protein
VLQVEFGFIENSDYDRRTAARISGECNAVSNAWHKFLDGHGKDSLKPIHAPVLLRQAWQKPVATPLCIRFSNTEIKELESVLLLGAIRRFRAR